LNGGRLISDELNRGDDGFTVVSVHTLTASRFSVVALPIKVLSTEMNPQSDAVPQMNLFQAVVLGMVQGLTEFAHQ